MQSQNRLLQAEPAPNAYKVLAQLGANRLGDEKFWRIISVASSGRSGSSRSAYSGLLNQSTYRSIHSWYNAMKFPRHRSPPSRVGFVF